MPKTFKSATIQQNLNNTVKETNVNNTFNEHATFRHSSFQFFVKYSSQVYFTREFSNRGARGAYVNEVLSLSWPYYSTLPPRVPCTRARKKNIAGTRSDATETLLRGKFCSGWSGKWESEEDEDEGGGLWGLLVGNGRAPGVGPMDCCLNQGSTSNVNSRLRNYAYLIKYSYGQSSFPSVWNVNYFWKEQPGTLHPFQRARRFLATRENVRWNYN